MPFTTPKTRNCMPGSSEPLQVTSHGKKRKHHLLWNVFDDSNLTERHLDDKGKKMAKKLKPNEGPKGGNGDYQSRSSKDPCTHGTSEQLKFSKASLSTPFTKIKRPRLSSKVSDQDDTQEVDKEARKIKKIKKAPKGKSYRPQEHHGILRNVAKLKSSQKPLSACPAISDTHRMFPDLFGGDHKKHIAQDNVVFASLKRKGFPVDIIGPFQEFFLLSIVVEVGLTAEKDDPDVPLKPTVTEVMAALRDEEFAQVVYRCYWMKSFRDIRNHPLFRISKVRFLEPSVGKH